MGIIIELEISKNSFQGIKLTELGTANSPTIRRKRSLFGEEGKLLHICDNRMDYRSALSAENQRQDPASLK